MVEDGGLWQRPNGKQSNFGFGIYKGIFGMTRKIEIIDESEKYYRECPWDVDRSDIQEAFVQGAQWADKTIIEKAYEYAKARYDLDYCGNVRDILDYLKSLTEE
jgi:hypothetical protein